MSERKTVNKTTTVLLNILLVLFVLIFIVSAYFLTQEIIERHKGKEYNNTIQNQVINEIKPTEEQKESVLPFKIDFEMLKKDNPEAVAWIYSPGTEINYPVMQGQDNEKYLNTLLDGSHNSCGSIFEDYRCSSDFSDYSSILYGHNMKNGTMFASIENYAEESYYKEHKQLYLFTPEKNYYMEVVGAMLIKETSKIFVPPQSWQEQKALYASFTTNSYFKSGIQLQQGDNLVMLSTCCRWDSTLRFVVLTRLVEIVE